MPTKSIKTRFKWLFGAYKGVEGVKSQSLAVKMSSKPKKAKSGKRKYTSFAQFLASGSTLIGHMPENNVAGKAQSSNLRNDSSSTANNRLNVVIEPRPKHRKVQYGQYGIVKEDTPSDADKRARIVVEPNSKELIEDYDSINSIGPTDDECDSNDNQQTVVGECKAITDTTREDAAKEREKEPVVSDVDGTEKDGQEGDDIRFNELIAQLLENRTEYNFAAHMFEGSDLEEETLSDQFKFYKEVDNLLALIQSSRVDIEDNGPVNKYDVHTAKVQVTDIDAVVSGSTGNITTQFGNRTKCVETEEERHGLTNDTTVINNETIVNGKMNDQLPANEKFGRPLAQIRVSQEGNHSFFDHNTKARNVRRLEDESTLQADTVDTSHKETTSCSEHTTDEYQYYVQDGVLFDDYGMQVEIDGTPIVVEREKENHHRQDRQTHQNMDESEREEGFDLDIENYTKCNNNEGHVNRKQCSSFFDGAKQQELSIAKHVIDSRLTMLKTQTLLMREIHYSRQRANRKHRAFFVSDSKVSCDRTPKKAKAAETFANPNSVIGQQRMNETKQQQSLMKKWLKSGSSSSLKDRQIPATDVIENHAPSETYTGPNKDLAQNSRGIQNEDDQQKDTHAEGNHTMIEKEARQLDKTHEQLLGKLRFLCPMPGCTGIATSTQNLRRHWFNSCHHFQSVPNEFRPVPIFDNDDNGDDVGDEREDDMDLSPVAPPRRGNK